MSFKTLDEEIFVQQIILVYFDQTPSKLCFFDQ